MNKGLLIDATTTADAPVLISIDGLPAVIGRSGAASVRLVHPSISRRHATVCRVAGGFVVEDHDSRSGTFVNGTRVRVATVRPGDRVQFGPAIAYRVEAAGLRLDVMAGGMSLDAAGLSISVAEAHGLWRRMAASLQADPSRSRSGFPEHGPRRALIADIDLHIEPDSFTGILGPSGAGKSTLLNVLAGRSVSERGRLIFDGRGDAYRETDTYRAMTGHVPQDDVVFPSLTVRESLDFAARLRLGREIGPDALNAAIAGALDRVALAEHVDKRVAVLSGGQRKRLGVAVELLRRPRLLLLDEPTSGLDPASEASLMEGLRHLARRGTTVVCTTHLMDNLGLLDNVVVLGVVDGVGRLAYTGPPAGLLPHFRCRGFADLYEVLASGRFEPVVSRPEGSPADVGGAITPRNAPGPVEARSGTGTLIPSSRPEIGRSTANAAAETGLDSLRLVTRRGLRLALRDHGLMLAMAAQPVVLGLLVALSQYDVSNPFPILFFAVVIATWLGLNNSARDLVRERRHYVRDRLAGLGPAAYLGAKALVHAAFGLGQVLILLAVLHVGGGLVLDPHAASALGWSSLPRLASVLMLAYLGGVGLGLLASTLARTEEAAVAVLPLLIMPQLLISAVATGFQNEPYTKVRPFRPLVVTLERFRELTPPAALVDVLSLACPSRPAVLVAESKSVSPYGQWLWLGDLSHLVILLLGTWTLVFLAFGRAERRWLRLMDL